MTTMPAREAHRVAPADAGQLHEMKFSASPKRSVGRDRGITCDGLAAARLDPVILLDER